MNISRKPYVPRDQWKTVDFAAVRADILDVLREGPKNTEEVIKALSGRWTRHALMHAIRYAKEDKYIYREKHNQPWRIR